MKVLQLHNWSCRGNRNVTQTSSINYKFVEPLTAVSFPLALSADCLVLFSANYAGIARPSFDPLHKICVRDVDLAVQAGVSER